MKAAIFLRLPDGRFLANDFKTWTDNIADAHRFIPGATLNACREEFQRLGARSVLVQVDPPPEARR